MVEPGQLGPGGFAQLVKQSGNFVGDLNVEYADKTLDYSDLGYGERSDVLSGSTNLEYRLPRAGPLIESRLRFEFLSPTTNRRTGRRDEAAVSTKMKVRESLVTLRSKLSARGERRRRRMR